MQPGIQLSSITRLALVIVIIAVAVGIIHFLAKSVKLGKQPLKLALSCFVVFLVSAAGLFALSQGIPDNRQIDNFKPFTVNEFSNAATLVEDAVESNFNDSSDGDTAEIADLNLVYIDGEFGHLKFTAHIGGGDTYWQRTLDVTTNGIIVAGGRIDSPGPGSALPLDAFLGAMHAIEESGLISSLGIPENAGLSVTLNSPSVPEAYSGSAAHVFYGGGLMPIDEYLAGTPAPSVFPLALLSGDISHYVLITI